MLSARLQTMGHANSLHQRCSVGAEVRLLRQAGDREGVELKDDGRNPGMPIHRRTVVQSKETNYFGEMARRPGPPSVQTYVDTFFPLLRPDGDCNSRSGMSSMAIACVAD